MSVCTISKLWTGWISVSVMVDVFRSCRTSCTCSVGVTGGRAARACFVLICICVAMASSFNLWNINV